MASNESSPLAGLLVRAAVVRDPALGFVLACDPKLAAADVDHTISFRWKSGVFNAGRAKYSAIALCIVERPEYGVVKVSASGVYSVETRAGIAVSNLFRDASPARSSPRFGDLRSVVAIDGRAYAVGFEGMVFRLDGPNRWARIDEGLPESFDIEALDGFTDDELYAVGFGGQAWARVNQVWEPLDVGVNTVLTSVHCSEHGDVHAAGHRGVLIRGRGAMWEVLPQDMKKDIWGLAWFGGQLYVSTLSGLYRLVDDLLEPVDFGADPPKTTYRLSAANGVLWSIGAKDLMAFDGVRWSRIA